MKKLFIYTLISVAVIGCDSTSESLKKDEDPASQNGFNASTSVFEGTWTWIETSGVDFEGQHYKQDSITEGYSLRYKFFETEGQGGKMKTIKSNETSLLYQYEYTDSQIAANFLDKKITLDKMTNSAPEIFYWEIRVVQVSEENTVHLYLRNAEYFTDACCNGKIEMHFVLADGPNL